MSTITCPNCGAPIGAQSKFCPKCGHVLGSRPPVAGTQLPQAPGPQSAPGGSQCPYCHVPLRPNVRFCSSCGRSLPSGPVPSAAGFGGGAAVPVGGGAPVPAGSPGGGATVSLGQAGGPPTLLIRWPGGQVDRRPMLKPSVNVGRAPNNDVVIDHPSVSGRHMFLDFSPSGMTVTDLRSTNGTQLNGQLIPVNVATPFNPGDVLRIGDLTGNSVAVSVEPEGGQSIRTLALGQLDLTTVNNILIGRDPSCYLPLAHPTVSTRHAMIYKQNGGLRIKDMGSTNGTFINGQRILDVPLNNGDEITIGPFRLVYNAQAQSLAQSMRLGHRLDAVRLGREVKDHKMILEDVTLTIQSGEFVALVGGSGAGKSTLMKAMNGYEPATQGQMMLDGELFYPKMDLYRTQMGYVPQDDIIHRELPVKLALWYAAKLRLPDATPAEIDARIADALRAVDMTAHTEKKVSELSGGQRKRVSIAAELLAKPTLFFLDEPTSGLDPGLEKKMMYDMNHLADEGRTVVMVTHATANIEQCDYVAFMSWGRLAYYGPPKDATKFFNCQDFADIYLRLTQEINPNKGKPVPSELQQFYPQFANQEVKPAAKLTGMLWAEKFRNSPFFKQYVTDRQSSLGAGAHGGAGVSAPPLRPSRDSFFRQAYLLARRQIDLIRMNFTTLAILVLMMPFIGLLFMLVSKKDDLTGRMQPIAEIEDDLREQAFSEYENYSADEYDEKDEDRDWSAGYTPYSRAKMLLVMIGLALTQGGTFGAAYEIVKERAIFKRERAVNLSVIAYVLSKVLVLALFALIQVAAVVLIIGLKVDLGFESVLFPDLEIGGALEMFIILYLGVLASIGFGLMLSAIVPSTDVVLYAILAELFVQIILSGTLFPLPSNPISFLTPGYWTMNGLGSSVDLPRLDEDARKCVVPSPDKGAPAPPDASYVDCNPAAAREESIKSFDHTEEKIFVAGGALLGLTILFIVSTIIVQTKKKIT